MAFSRSVCALTTTPTACKLLDVERDKERGAGREQIDRLLATRMAGYYKVSKSAGLSQMQCLPRRESWRSMLCSSTRISSNGSSS